MSNATQTGAKIVIGHGAARGWALNASAMERDDADLIAAAHAARLFDIAQLSGYATRSGGLLQDAWLVVCDVDDSDLDYDPAVIAYCAAPTTAAS